MKTNLKRRLLSILLCGIMLAGALSPIYAEEESSASVYTVNTVYDDLIDLPDSDELLEGYLQQQIYDGVSFYGTTAGDRLEGIEKTVYNELKLKLEKVASGEISSTIFKIESDISSLSWTKEQLGVSAIVSDGEFTAEALSAVRVKFNGVFDTSKLLNCLLADCPYELYWFDKNKEGSMKLSYEISYNGSEISISFLTFSYMVAEAYKGADDYTANISKTSAVATAVANAKDIVDKYASKSDLEKLDAYRAEICELVSYNHSATGDGVSYGDPWQLIYVFDGDPNTNVVCEGYAKAFQYLCDLSEFTGDVVCNTVTGTMNGGPHMWNVVEYGSKYYLVDITNCDEGSIGADTELFMVGTDLKDGDRTYTFTIGSSQVVYVYDKEQSDLICDGYPVLSESSLSNDETNIYSGTCGDNVKWSLDTDTGVLTISGSGDMYYYGSGSNYAPWDSQKDSIKSVYIENGVTSIGTYAFYYCESLTSVTIPDSVTSIGGGAFEACSSLASINIPYSVTSIGVHAFYDCDSLTSITIPDSVTSIGDYAFYGTAYYNNGTNWKNNVLFIGNHLIEANNTISGSYTVRTGTKTIADFAFRACSSLASIIIPDSVTRIGEYAFSFCSSLTSITIPASVTSIGSDAFYNCYSLTSITIPDSVTSIGIGAFSGTAYSNNAANWKDKVLFIGNHLIEAKDSVSGSYTVPEGTKTIADGAFEDCSNLKCITIPDGVTSISDYAFRNCRRLTSTTIGNGVTIIGNSAFDDCYSLTSINIPDSVTIIGNSAFNYCESLTSITIPNSVTRIGYNAFYGCDNLTIKCRINSAAYNYAVTNNISCVLIKDYVDTPVAPEVESVTNNTVTLKKLSGYEYSKDGKNWQSSNVFTGLNAGTSYTFYQRTAETNTSYASAASDGLKVTTNKNTVSTPKAPTVAGKTTNTVTLTKVTGCEYSIDGKTWQSSNVFKNLKAETEYTFYQRKAETDTSYASDKSVALKVKTMPKESLMNEKGVWYYTVNDKKVNATTLVNYYGTWYYVEKGKVNFNATTLCNYGGTWYYVEKGKVNWKCDTLCYYGGTWYYANNGKVDWKCDTLCYYGGTWYYAKNGKVNWKSDTLCYYGGTWYYAKNGKVDWNCNTLCKYGGTWYYAKNGKVNWKSDTLCYYGGTWYYAKNGKVDWNCNTLCKYGNTWYYVQKGKVNWNAKTLCKYGNTWYYVEKGKLNFNATLRFNYYGKSYNVRNGVVKF